MVPKYRSLLSMPSIMLLLRKSFWPLAEKAEVRRRSVL